MYLCWLHDHSADSCYNAISGCFLKLRFMLLNQCFLEESRQLMRLPPRQSTAEADLIVPFQLVSDNLFLVAKFLLMHNLILSHYYVFFVTSLTRIQPRSVVCCFTSSWQICLIFATWIYFLFLLLQAALKTIGDEDKYFARVSLRYVCLAHIVTGVKPWLVNFSSVLTTDIISLL